MKHLLLIALVFRLFDIGVLKVGAVRAEYEKAMAQLEPK